MMKTQAENALELIFPKGIFDWFDITASSINEEDIHITFQEKNLPPVSEHTVRKRIEPKGFTEITITDFPIRGRRSLLTFKRRYWQVEGEDGYLKRDIKLSFPGTQLETEFAHFLKEDGGKSTGLTGFYRRVATPPDQRI
jgi:hypothetical protein